MIPSNEHADEIQFIVTLLFSSLLLFLLLLLFESIVYFLDIDILLQCSKWNRINPLLSIQCVVWCTALLLFLFRKYQCTMNLNTENDRFFFAKFAKIFSYENHDFWKKRRKIATNFQNSDKDENVNTLYEIPENYHSFTQKLATQLAEYELNIYWMVGLFRVCCFLLYWAVRLPQRYCRLMFLFIWIPNMIHDERPY